MLPPGCQAAAYAPAGWRGRKSSWRISNAQPIRAFLLANATATTFIGLFTSSFFSHGSCCACLDRSTDIAPFTSSLRRYPSPRLLIGPSLTLPPVPSWRGTMPSEAAKCRPLSNALGSVTRAATAVAVTGPKPGMVRRWRLLWSVRLQAASAWSILPSWISNASSILANTARPARSGSGMRVSSGSATIARNACMPLLPLGATMPNAPINARSEFIVAVLLDQHLAHTVDAGGGLLRLGLRRDEAHRRAADRLADRRRVGGVVLVAPDIGFDIARRDQTDRVAEPGEFACPVVRAGAGFHADQARRQLAEPVEHLAATQRAPQHHLFLSIDAVHLEDGLRQVKAKSANLLHGWLPLVEFDNPTLAHRCREGAIHPIMAGLVPGHLRTNGRE